MIKLPASQNVQGEDLAVLQATINVNITSNRNKPQATSRLRQQVTTEYTCTWRDQATRKMTTSDHIYNKTYNKRPGRLWGRNRPRPPPLFFLFKIISTDRGAISCILVEFRLA